MYRLGQIAAKLNVAPTQIQRWTRDYADWLSQEAAAPKRARNGRLQTRHYSEDDLAALQRIQQGEAAGLTRDEVALQLSAPATEERASDGAPPVATAQPEDPTAPAETPPDSAEHGAAELAQYEPVQLLQQTIESHHALLAAQQAHREILNVMLQDATALKNENSQLRKRLRMMEEQMTRLKESDWNHRLTLEERMSQLEAELAQAKSKPRWWDRLLGRP